MLGGGHGSRGLKKEKRRHYKKPARRAPAVAGPAGAPRNKPLQFFQASPQGAACAPRRPPGRVT